MTFSSQVLCSLEALSREFFVLFGELPRPGWHLLSDSLLNVILWPFFGLRHDVECASSNKVWVRSIIPDRHLWQLFAEGRVIASTLRALHLICAFAIVVTDLTACGTVVYFAGIFGMTKFLTVEAAQWVRDVD